MPLGADELAVEQPVDELGRELVPARDQVDERRKRPASQAQSGMWMYSSIVSICLWRKRTGTLSRRPKRGRAAERDPDIDHRRPPHRLDDEQAQDPVDEEEGARHFLGRLAASEQVAEQRGFLRELGEQIGRKADQAAPDHPADALIVARREVPPAPDQDRERADADRKADEQQASRPDFGAVAEDGSHAQRARRLGTRSPEPAERARSSAIGLRPGRPAPSAQTARSPV